MVVIHILTALFYLSLFFKILPFCNTAAFWPLFTFTTQNMAPFLTWSTTFTNFIALHRINSNAILPILTATGVSKTTQPHCIFAPATPTILGFTARQMSQLPTRLCGQGHWTPNLHGQWGGCFPFEPTLKFSLYSLFKAKGSRKIINIFSHFPGLFLDTN